MWLRHMGPELTLSSTKGRGAEEELSQSHTTNEESWLKLVTDVAGSSLTSDGYILVVFLFLTRKCGVGKRYKQILGQRPSFERTDSGLYMILGKFY